MYFIDNEKTYTKNDIPQFTSYFAPSYGKKSIYKIGLDTTKEDIEKILGVIPQIIDDLQPQEIIEAKETEKKTYLKRVVDFLNIVKRILKYFKSG